ncbi:transposase [Mycobacterium lacus]|uniref:Transposase n=1 Tax=Mycobacterium lacus TaxID=169765 RepID=A0A7I7NJQ9_9MYCO|nr:transposase [Mycobacterium lacus]MCV7125758.1 transposase [Mycobacterium lacus]BBX95921.1 transposase [Mycobacterium lacus]
MTATLTEVRTCSTDDEGVGTYSTVGPRADRPRRRTFTPEYKAAIVAEYDAMTEPGARGALLRREGLYSSHIVEWRRARDAGALDGLARSGGRGSKDRDKAEIERLRKRAERAEAELERTRAALDLAGKAHALLETLSESTGTRPGSKK